MPSRSDLAPHPAGVTPLCGNQKGTFAYTTVKDRLPVILTKCIDSISRELHAATTTTASDASSLPPLAQTERATEGKQIIAELSKLVYELQRDRPLQRINDTEEDAASWNSVLESLGGKEGAPATWFGTPWLFSECHMYRKIREIFVVTNYWKDHDVFARQQKEPSFWGSVKSMEELAKHVKDVEASTLDEELKTNVLREFVQFSLWGNQTDLSLLQNVSHADMHKLQTSTSASLEQLEEKIIVNDSKLLVDAISKIKNGRIDFILDNAGFELYADLCLADWLVHSGVAKQVVIHAKRIPWFVSDTTERDFYWTLDAIQQHATHIGDDTLHSRIQTWQAYLEKGTWKLTVDPFWTLPYSFWQLPTEGGRLWDDMCTSQLLIFKGDLNYRKCVYDGNWATTTPFSEALGGLNDPQTPPLVCLRTCKSDPVVGLRPGQAEELDKADPDWRVNGKWGMIQYQARAAQ
ncbi:hypothetical protein DFJ77DRAFT_445212 [Powellomyces hirtus]|nr:hypothetical protein DFJ77DRAFT_445212 [Powellomyces hirtus]